jgi:hypothetical protein
VLELEVRGPISTRIELSNGISEKTLRKTVVLSSDALFYEIYFM